MLLFSYNRFLGIHKVADNDEGSDGHEFEK